jgi:hypothetical protein
VVDGIANMSNGALRRPSQVRTLIEILDKLRFKINDLKRQQHYIACHWCSPLHRKKRRTLSVKIASEGVIYICHRCRKKGAEFYVDWRPR